MSEFEDKLHAILSDPEELERIASLASALMGGGASAPSGAPPAPEGDLLRRLSGLLGASPGQGELGALADALSPYLQPERSARLRRALRLAGMLRVAGTVLGEEASERV